MFNLFRGKRIYINTDLLQGARLKAVLDQIISPPLKDMGLHWRGDYYWISEVNNGVRKVFRYDLLKGGQGTFTWGITLDIIPLPSGDRLVYHKTEKNLKLHLFEQPKGYTDSFRGKKIKHGYGVTEHWGIDKTNQTIRKALEGELGKIETWFKLASSFEGVLELAEKQVAEMKEINIATILFIFLLRIISLPLCMPNQAGARRPRISLKKSSFRIIRSLLS